MSFREKSAWISVISMTAIYGFYFWTVVHGPRPSHFHVGGLLATIIALIVLQVTLTIVVAIFKPSEAGAPRDERDKLIELRAMRVAYSGLATSVAMACFFGAIDPPIVFNTNALLFILVTAEIMRSACQIIQYRRGA
jgi:uncharacterized membrane protein